LAGRIGIGATHKDEGRGSQHHDQQNDQEISIFLKKRTHCFLREGLPRLRFYRKDFTLIPYNYEYTMNWERTERIKSVGQPES